jgi:hypothetical protein
MGGFLPRHRLNVGNGFAFIKPPYRRFADIAGMDGRYRLAEPQDLKPCDYRGLKRCVTTSIAADVMTNRGFV